MTNNREHVDLDVLNDYVDGLLPTPRRAVVSAHLGVCSTCRVEHEQLVLLLEAAASVPKSVLPPEDTWSGIRASINQRKEVVLPISDSAGRSAAAWAPGNRPWWSHRSFLVAAGLILMVVSSAVTAIVLRSSGGSIGSVASTTSDTMALTSEARMLPAGFREAEREYLMSIGDLRSVLQSHRSVLKPETVAAVEHSLAVIDGAIEEARNALLSDPNNQTLVDLLTANYERKLDLLRRAADLGART